MIPRSRQRVFTFTLAEFLILVTLVSVWMALGRAIGFLATTLFVMAPVPAVGYLVLVRYTMRRLNVDFQTRSILANVALAVGFAAAIFLSVAIAAIALSNLTTLTLHTFSGIPI